MWYQDLAVGQGLQRLRISDESEGIEESWVATLKPTTIGVPAFRDGTREYLEIAVLNVTLRAASKAERLTELLHRAVPYPLFLLMDVGTGLSVSLAHKRWSEGEAGATVLDGDLVAAAVAAANSSQVIPAFLRALSLNAQPRADLFKLYQGCVDAVLALLTAQITGSFSLPTTPHAFAVREHCAKPPS